MAAVSWINISARSAFCAQNLNCSCIRSTDMKGVPEVRSDDAVRVMCLILDLLNPKA